MKTSLDFDIQWRFLKKEKKMLIFYYIVLWQITETLSIVFPKIVFLIIHYVLHVNIADARKKVKRYSKIKIAITLLLIEASAFLAMYPFICNVFSTYTKHFQILALSILLLQLIPWIFKFQKAKELLEETNEDTAIYQ